MLPSREEGASGEANAASRGGGGRVLVSVTEI